MTTLNEREIREYLTRPDTGELFARADAVRRQQCGDTVFLRGILEFSNYCANNCRYCGLRRDNHALSRYRMTVPEIIDHACDVMQSGVATVVLQSGDDYAYTRDDVCRIVTGIKTRHPDGAITLSAGERSDDDYRAFKDSGADRYLIKHETANPSLYAALHPGQSHSRRIEILRVLRQLGYQVGTGFIVGVPGQTLDDQVNEIRFLAELQPDMAGIGPFLPQHDTPFADEPAGPVDTTLRLLAMARIVTGTTHLPATTALASADPDAGLEAGLRAGCNIIMSSFTPAELRAKYRIYDKRSRLDKERIERAIRNCGRVLSGTRGDSLKK